MARRNSLITFLEHYKNGEHSRHFDESIFAHGYERARYELFENRDNSQAPLITHARHRTHLESAFQFLEAFLGTCKSASFLCSLLHCGSCKPINMSSFSTRRHRSRRRRAAICSASHWESIWIDRRGGCP